MRKIKYGFFLTLLFFFCMLCGVDALGEKVRFSVVGDILPGTDFVFLVGTNGITDVDKVKGFSVSIESNVSGISLVQCEDVSGGTGSVNGNQVSSQLGSVMTGDKNLLKCTYHVDAGVAGDTDFSITLGSGSQFLLEDGTTLDISGSRFQGKVMRVKSSDATLKSLILNEGNLTPTFSSDVYRYQVTVASNIDKVNIYASCNEEHASVVGDGEHKLNYGTNSFSVVVMAENGEKKTYFISVTRTDNRSLDTSLKYLAVKDLKFQEAFSSDVKRYQIDAPYEIEKVIVYATPTHSKAKVLVTGATTLVVGKHNLIYVTVTSEKGNKEDYIIDIYRKEKVEESKPIEDDKKEDDKEEEKPNDKVDEKEEVEEPVEEKKNNKIILYVLMGGSFVLLIVLGVAIIKTKE